MLYFVDGGNVPVANSPNPVNTGTGVVGSGGNPVEGSSGGVGQESCPVSARSNKKIGNIIFYIIVLL